MAELREKHLLLIATKPNGIREIRIEEVGRWDIPNEISYAKLRMVLDSLAHGDPMGPCIEREVVTGKWVSTRGWVCGNCNHGLHGYPRFCGMCGGRIHYEKREDEPKAVLD
jgi:hypothetical protein